MGKTISERMAALERRGDELAGVPATLAGLHPVHAQTLDVLGELMHLGSSMSGGDVPTHLRVMMTMLDKGRPMLAEGIAALDPAQIQAFMAQLVGRIQTIIDTPLEVGGSAHDASPAGTDHPRADLATPA